jgi:hypothetical protein
MSKFQEHFPSLNQQETVLARLQITDPQAAKVLEYFRGAVALSVQMSKTIIGAIMAQEKSGKVDAVTAKTFDTIRDELQAYAMFQSLQLLSDPESKAKMLDHFKELGYTTVVEQFEEVEKKAHDFYEKEDS